MWAPTTSECIATFFSFSFYASSLFIYLFCIVTSLVSVFFCYLHVCVCGGYMFTYCVVRWTNKMRTKTRLVCGYKSNQKQKQKKKLWWWWWVVQQNVDQQIPTTFLLSYFLLLINDDKFSIILFLSSIILFGLISNYLELENYLNISI